MSDWLIDPSRALDVEEGQRVLAAARNLADAGRAANRFRDARDGHLACFLFDAGCRVTEALRATVGDVTSHKEAVYVRLLNLKRNTTDATPVPIMGRGADRARVWVAWLREHGAKDDCPLFPVRPLGVGVAPRAISRQGAWVAVRRLLRGVGIDRAGVAVHAIRHSVAIATLKASNGNMRIVQGRLRHRSVTTTETYARLMDEDFKRGIEAGAALLEGSE